MAIRWSAGNVKDAMDMVEKFVAEADEPLEQARIVAREARKIDNLPDYMDTRIYRVIDQIERIDNVKSAIKAVREDIPQAALKQEQERIRHGTTQKLV